MTGLPWTSEARDAFVWRGSTLRIDNLANERRAAQQLIRAACLCTGVLLFIDAIWFALSPLRFAPGNWGLVATLLLAGALEIALLLMLPDDARGKMHGVIRRCALLCRGVGLLVLIVATFFVFSYLATAAALPLQDDLLARIDRQLGFDWPRLLAMLNSMPRLAAVLTFSYHSTGPLLVAIVIWLALSERRARLAELLAALSFTFAGLAAGMVAVPTAGAFAHYAPATATFDNFIGAPDLWPFYVTFSQLRDGSLTLIEFSTAAGIVGFPSFHAALSVVTAYAVRDQRWPLAPVLLLNGIMLVATLPVGGHHLSELIGGVLTGLIAIAVTRWCRDAASPFAARTNPVTSRRMSA